MIKYLKLIGIYLKSSFLREMEFRVNFFIWFIVDIGWGLLDLLFFSTLVANIGSLGNWTKGEVFVVIGLFRILAIFIWGWLFPSFKNIPRLISQGELDMVLIKPIDSQFGVSITQFSLNMTSSLMTGLAYLFFGFKIIGHAPTLPGYLYLVWLLIVAVILVYGMYFLTVSIALYFDRINNIANLFPHFADAARFPKEIYPSILQKILITVWPVAIILAVPAEAIFGRPNFLLILWMHILTILFLISGRLLWTMGLKRYSSASS